MCYLIKSDADSELGRHRTQLIELHETESHALEHQMSLVHDIISSAEEMLKIQRPENINHVEEAMLPQPK